MTARGKATKYPGVYIVDHKTYWIRAKALDQRTGRTKEIEKLIEAVSLQEAAHKRAELIGAASCRGAVRPCASRTRPS